MGNEKGYYKMEKTALYNFHKNLGAKFVPFAGYEMPIQYKEGIVKEHISTRQSAGFFDVSHMGQLYISGNNSAEKSLEKIIPLDFKEIKTNQSKYSFLINEKGGVIDDIIITRVEGGFNIILNAACKDNDIKEIKMNQSKYSFLINEKGGVIDDLIITRVEGGFNIILNAACKDNDIKEIAKCLNSESKYELRKDLSLVALQGPKSEIILESIVKGVKQLKFMNGGYFEFQGKKIYITRSGYTGEDGFEISVPNTNVENFTKLLTNKGAKPIGLGARDTLRLEAGLCLYGHELNQDINPVQANLKWAISKRRREKGGFNGWEKIKDDLQNGVSKIRVGIKPSGRIIAREGAKIFSSSGEEIGVITSGTFGPSVNSPVAMGYIKSKFSEINNKILLEVRGKKHEAVVSKLPFYKKSYVK